MRAPIREGGGHAMDRICVVRLLEILALIRQRHRPFFPRGNYLGFRPTGMIIIIPITIILTVSCRHELITFHNYCGQEHVYMVKSPTLLCLLLNSSYCAGEHSLGL